GGGSTPSTMVATMTSAGVVLGTIGYMAPEEISGGPTDHRADIFAFGAILYEMLTGRRAFRRSSPAETTGAIIREDPDPSGIPHGLPPALLRLMGRCLEKRPERRFQSARDLMFALDAVSAGSSVGSTPAPNVTPGPAADVRGRQRLWFAVVTAVAVAGA